MFEKQKHKEKEKLEILKEQLAEIEQKEFNCVEEMNTIDRCWNLREDINDRKKEMTVLTLIGSFLVFSTLTPHLIIVGVFLYIIDIYEVISIVKKKEKMRRKYGELCNYSKKELEEEWWNLSKQQFYNEHTKRVLNSKINHCKGRIEKLKQNANNILKLADKVLLEASNEEEYYYLKQKQEEQLEVLNDFLDEKVDYSNVHFDNSIGENIEYIENSKQLLKKLPKYR